VQFDREASQTRDYCVAKNATHRAARPDPSLRKERLFRMTIKLHHTHNRMSAEEFSKSATIFATTYIECLFSPPSPASW
jgi:hypothetical protein